MNEVGKSFYSSFSFSIFLLLLGLSSVPYSDLFKQENLERLLLGDDMPEKFIIFMSCAAFFGFLVFLSYLFSGILSLLVHLVLRFLFLYKLRKPMLIYTGDPDRKASESKLSKRLDYFLFYFACALSIFCAFCMIFSE